jgi:hypothetical protein
MVLAVQPASLTCSDEVLVSPITATIRRNSEISVQEGPITPPLSPPQSEAGADDAIIVESDRHFINVDNDGCSPPRILGSSPNTQPGPSEDMETKQTRMATPPRPPLRLLEDEQVHVERSGLLGLTDFEIKGTLGLLCRLSHIE